jgi:hypothetical protein
MLQEDCMCPESSLCQKQWSRSRRLVYSPFIQGKQNHVLTHCPPVHCEPSRHWLHSVKRWRHDFCKNWYLRTGSLRESVQGVPAQELEPRRFW